MIKYLYIAGILACMLLNFQNAKAQQQQLKFETGIHAGLNISDLSGMDESYDPFAGYLVGFSVESGYVGRPFSLETGVSYYRNGASRHVQGVRTDFITEYFSFPLLLKYYFYDYGLSGVNIYTGPKADILVSSEVIFKMGEDTITEDFSDQTTNLMYSFLLGAGTKIQKGNINFSLRIQYSRSLNDVYNGEVLRGGRNNNLSVIAGLFF
jgi:hypothetical protein